MCERVRNIAVFISQDRLNVGGFPQQKLGMHPSWTGEEGVWRGTETAL